MAYKLATAFVDIVARSTGLNKSFDQVRRDLGGLLGTLREFGGALGIGLGIGAAVAASRSFISAAMESYDAEARLRAVIKTTGGAAGKTAEQIMSMASAIQQTTGTSDELVTDAASKLLTFKSISGDMFDRAMKGALDLSATGFGGLMGTTLQLGKALENPVKGMNALTRSGVTFTAAEQAKIKALVASNQLLKAQEIVMKAVEGQVGGVAEALGKTPAGQWRIISARIGEVGEALGKRILPLATSLISVSASIAEGFLSVLDTVMMVNEALGGWPAKLLVATTIIANLPKLIGAVRIAIDAVKQSIVAAQLLTGWGAILVVLGLIAVAIYEIGRYLAGLPEIQKAWAEAVEKLRVVWERVKQIFTVLGGYLKDAFSGALQWIEQAFGISFQGIEDGFVGFLSGLITGLAEFMADAAEWALVIVTKWSTVTALIQTGIAFLGSYMFEVFRANIGYIAGYLPGRLISAAVEFVSWFSKALLDMAVSFAMTLSSFIASIPSMIANAITKGVEVKEAIDKMAVKAAGGITSAIADSVNEAKTQGQKFGEGFKHGMAGIGPKLDLGMSEANRKRLEEAQRLMGELTAEKEKLETGRADLFKVPEIPKGAVVPPKVEVEQTLKIESGLMGITDAWRKVQEAMLGKTKGKDDKMIGLLGDGVATGNKALEQQVKTNDLLGKIATGGAVA